MMGNRALLPDHAYNLAVRTATMFLPQPQLPRHRVTGALDASYAAAGPANGAAVILPHGWLCDMTV